MIIKQMTTFTPCFFILLLFLRLQQFNLNEWEAEEGKSRHERGGGSAAGVGEGRSNRGDQGVKVAVAGKWVAS